MYCDCFSISFMNEVFARSREKISAASVKTQLSLKNRLDPKNISGQRQFSYHKKKSIGSLLWEAAPAFSKLAYVRNVRVFGLEKKRKSHIWLTLQLVFILFYDLQNE